MSGSSPKTLSWLVPAWPAPAAVRALSTLRAGGVSRGPYTSLNLAAHVGDRREAVVENRARLMRAAGVPAEPRWLAQEHGTQVVEAAGCRPGTVADGSFTLDPGVVCAVLSADCLPVLLCDVDGAGVAAVHGGWRGLASGVLEEAVAALRRRGVRGRLLAWLGPAIGPDAFEVGDEVRSRFLAHDPAAAAGFRHVATGRWMADLYVLARQRLEALGGIDVYGGGWCTFRDAARFYSYRRDRVTGRMASLIWLEPAAKTARSPA